MWRKRLTVYPWGMLETIEYDDRGIESVGLIASEADSDPDETSFDADQSSESRRQQR